MEKLNMQTTDVVDENIKRIGEMFPNCLTEVKDEKGRPQVAIDFDQLRQELSKNIVEGPEERYQFTWPDKRNAIRLANAPTTDTLRPCREESVDFDNTQNLYIEGDNLQVLKLLRENYLGKVKMIYIDPPYNTGNDFVYNDNFDQDKQEYVHNSGQYDEEGNQLVTNTESNGRFHTDWLNMIYPRLKVAKDLLSEDGVIFISIDDNEVENLRKICDEVFGEDNFVNCIAVKMSEASGVKMNHAKKRYPKIKEYVLLYKKSMFPGFCMIDKYPIDSWDNENNIFIEDFSVEDRKVLEELEIKEINSHEDAKIANSILSKAHLIPLNEAKKKYNIKNEDEQWLFDNSFRIIKTAGSSSLAKLVKSLPSIPEQDIASAVSPKGVLFFYITKFNRETKQPRLQVIFADSNIYKNPCDFWQDIKTTGAIASEGGVNYNNGKKPLKLLNRMVKMVTKDSDIVLDFFSGSATTAHSVIQQNLEQSMHRKFIMVQLDEDLDKSLKIADGENKETIKDTIDFLDSIGKPHKLTELGKERIRRTAARIRAERPEAKDLDTGFRVLKLDSSNMQDVYYTPEDFDQRDLFEDNIKSDRTEEDLLFQTMIELGIELSCKIEQTLIAGKTVWNVSDGYLMACFDENVNESTITEIAKQQPYYFVMRDSSLANDNVADNFEQIFDHYSKDTIRRII